MGFMDDIKNTYEINEIKNKLIDLLESNKKKLEQIALGELATQVAHDIRSPLATLQMVSRNMQFTHENHRIMVRSVIQRITDIANNLLIQYKTINHSETSDETILITPELIAPLVDSIVSEKRIQHVGTNITLIENITDKSNAVFARVELDKFKRALSNLINNAFEASDNTAIVRVNLDKKENMLILTIVDTGCGISAEMLPEVLKGRSIGKSTGTGLGLTTTVQLTWSWSGRFSIQSQIGKGTTIEIFLPETLPLIGF